MRTRSRGALDKPVQFDSVSYNKPLCTTEVATTTTYTSPQLVGLRRVMLDVVGAQYHKRRRRGEWVLNPMTISETEMVVMGSSDVTITNVVPVCSGTYYQREREIGALFGYALRASASFGNSILISAQESSDLLSEIATEVLAKRQSGSANYVESLAELDKAFSMLAHPLENVVKFLKAFRRHAKKSRVNLSLGGVNDVVTFASSEWLRFRYGITPLIGDCREGIKALKKQYSVKPKYFTARANGRLEKASTLSGSVATIGIYSITYRTTKRHISTARAQWTDSYVAGPWTDLGLTFHNLVGVGWELTHFSFVADWFGNVGPLIYANIPRVGVTSLGGTKTIDDTWTTVYDPMSTSLNSGGYTLSGAASDRVYVRNTVRDRSLHSGVGEFVIKADFRLDHFIRCTDAVALIQQQLSRFVFEKHLR